MLDLLSGLVNKSLVLAEPKGDALRYRMLETLRQYGAENLQDSGEQDLMRRRHLQWFRELAERSQSGLAGPEMKATLDLWETELDNFRAALELSMADGDAVEAGLRLAASLMNLWWFRGRVTDGRRWLAGLLALAPEDENGKQSVGSRTVARAEALDAVGFLAMRQNDLDACRSSYEASLAIWRKSGDKSRLAFTLRDLGRLERKAENLTRARSLLEESLVLARELGEKHKVCQAVYGLGELAQSQGEDDRAEALFEETLALDREHGGHWYMAMALRSLAAIALQRGEVTAARTRLRESLALGREIGETAGVAPVLELLAGLAASESQPVRVLRLAGAAQALRQSIGWMLTPGERAQNEATLKPAREALDEAAAEADPLTPREREVAVLVARGLTNRQIAAELVIAEGTAGIHVDHIFSKLGLHSRAQIAAWAVGHGLVSPSSALGKDRPSQ